MGEKLKLLLEAYGRVGIATYFVVFFLTLAGFAVAITFGVKVGSAQAGAGLLLASWLATKLTQPLRIAATLVLTPFVAATLKKLQKRDTASEAAPKEPPAS